VRTVIQETACALYRLRDRMMGAAHLADVPRDFVDEDWESTDSELRRKGLTCGASVPSLWRPALTISLTLLLFAPYSAPAFCWTEQSDLD
jgi:hypothetical protein